MGAAKRQAKMRVNEANQEVKSAIDTAKAKEQAATEDVASAGEVEATKLKGKVEAQKEMSKMEEQQAKLEEAMAKKAALSAIKTEKRVLNRERVAFHKKETAAVASATRKAKEEEDELKAQVTRELQKALKIKEAAKNVLLASKKEAAETIANTKAKCTKNENTVKQELLKMEHNAEAQAQEKVSQAKIVEKEAANAAAAAKEKAFEREKAAMDVAEKAAASKVTDIKAKTKTDEKAAFSLASKKKGSALGKQVVAEQDSEKKE